MSKCKCNSPGYCSLMKRQMSETRYNECKYKPGYFDVFLKDAEKKGGKPVSKPVVKPEKGPGTELKKLLKKIGIEATENCPCNSRIKKMDQEGISWCETNIEQIVDWMEEEANIRGLLFLRVLGRKLVRIAINKARKGK